MGVAFKNAGLLKQAEETFAKALGIWPKSAVMMNNLGNVYTLMKRLDEARVLYERAIAIYPDYKEAVYNLGQIYYFTGDTKKAIDLRIRLEKLRAQKVILTPRLAALSRIRSKKRVVN
jgi:Flp pilus assembly protein TadD